MVTQSEKEIPELERLYRLGLTNGVELSLVSDDEARKIEPRARTVEKAIFSPTTSSVDPGEVTNAFAKQASNENICLLPATRYLRRRGQTTVVTTEGDIAAGYIITAAGLHADSIARDYGFGEHYQILPFRGLYLYGDEPPGSLRVHVYPVPDPKYPFLGVHVTVTVDGHIKLGPNAAPALWREQYGGGDGFNASELFDVAGRSLKLFAKSNFDFRKLALTELKKTSGPYMVELASQLVSGIDPHLYRRWGRVGIRAQLIDSRTEKLATDYVLEGDDRSFHILNAVSPGFTSALSFSEYVAEKIGALLTQ